MLEYFILGLLMESNQNGYQMKQHMALSTSHFMDASYGSLYPALKRLVNKEFIVSKESVENSKNTKIYTITEEGKKAFLEWLAIPAEISGMPHDHVTKLYFYDYLDEDIKREHYQYYIDSAKYLKQKLVEIIPMALELSVNDRPQTMEYGVRYYNNLIEFYSGMLECGYDIKRHTK